MAETTTPFKERVAMELDRADVDALLYALDDPDEFFMAGERGEQMLTMWQRLHHARCHRDGGQGFHGDAASRSFALTEADAQNLWLLCGHEWIARLSPTVRARVRRIVRECRPSSRAATPMHPERASSLIKERSDCLHGPPQLPVQEALTPPTAAPPEKP